MIHRQTGAWGNVMGMPAAPTNKHAEARLRKIQEYVPHTSTSSHCSFRITCPSISPAAIAQVRNTMKCPWACQLQKEFEDIDASKNFYMNMTEYETPSYILERFEDSCKGQNGDKLQSSVYKISNRSGDVLGVLKCESLISMRGKPCIEKHILQGYRYNTDSPFSPSSKTTQYLRIVQMLHFWEGQMAGKFFPRQTLIVPGVFPVNFMVMECCKGGDFFTYLKRINKPERKQNKVKKYLNDICLALKTLHDDGILHRDLKPENVYIDDRADFAVLADFGVSCKISQLSDMTTMEGTNGFIAPEIESSRSYSKSSDIYALGVIFAEAFVKSKIKGYKNLAIQMLNPNPADRPNINLVIACLTGKKKFPVVNDVPQKTLNGFPESFNKWISIGALKRKKRIVETLKQNIIDACKAHRESRQRMTLILLKQACVELRKFVPMCATLRHFFGLPMDGGKIKSILVPSEDDTEIDVERLVREDLPAM